jgi:hypothetical protein
LWVFPTKYKATISSSVGTWNQCWLVPFFRNKGGQGISEILFSVPPRVSSKQILTSVYNLFAWLSNTQITNFPSYLLIISTFCV